MSVYMGLAAERYDPVLPTAEIASSMRAIGFTTRHTQGRGMTAHRWQGRYRVTVEPTASGWRVSVVRLTGSREYVLVWQHLTTLQYAADAAMTESMNIDLVLAISPSIVAELRSAA